MKGKKSQYKRVYQLINNDRYQALDRFHELLSCDLNRLFTCYFDYKNAPKLEISKQGDGYDICVKLQAQSIKSFHNITD